MSRLRKILKSLISSVTFWRDKEVPGVADTSQKDPIETRPEGSTEAICQELLKYGSGRAVFRRG